MNATTTTSIDLINADRAEFDRYRQRGFRLGFRYVATSVDMAPGGSYPARVRRAFATRDEAIAFARAEAAELRAAGTPGEWTVTVTDSREGGRAVYLAHPGLPSRWEYRSGRWGN